MKLRELDAHFHRYEERVETWERCVGDPLTWRERGQPTEQVTGPRQYMTPVETFAEAQGVFFRCPVCAAGKEVAPDGWFVGAHYIDVTFADRGALPHQGSHGKDGGPTRWQASGTGLDDLTTQPSILLDAECAWHGYITNGDAA